MRLVASTVQIEYCNKYHLFAFLALDLFAILALRYREKTK